MKIFVYSLIVIAVSLFTLYPSFKLSLFGDDWLVIYVYIIAIGSLSAGFLKHLHIYLSPYGPTHILMGILEQFYHYNSLYYYITSYLFRMFAAFSLLPLTYYLTKNKLSAFFAVLFFSVTATGFDTTNWVFNMTSYLGIGLVSLFLYLYVKSKEENRMKLLIPGVILLYLAYVTVPIRMHATLPLLILLESYWNYREKNFLFAKKSLQRLSAVIVIIVFIRLTGASFGQPTEAVDRFNEGINTIKLFISQGRYDFLFYPIISFGSIFIPDVILPISGQISSVMGLILNIVSPIILVFAIISKLLINLTCELKKSFFSIFISFAIIWTIIATVVYKGNHSSFSSALYYSLLLIGGYIFIIAILFIVRSYHRESTVTLLFLSLSWVLLSYIYAWLWQPEALYLTVHRYLIVGAAGAGVFLASLISLGRTKRAQMTIFLIFIPLIIVHIYTTRLYEYQLISSGHGQEIFNKIWSSMPYIPDINKRDKMTMFYFMGDNTNGNILHDSILFGFSPHMALLYNITDRNKVPLALESWEDTVSAVKDGKALVRYFGRPMDPVPIENVYVLKLEGRNNLIDITEEARKKLKQELN